jgi:ADP-ribosylglycohydrolase
MIGGPIGDIIGAIYEGRKALFNDSGLIVGYVKNNQETYFKQPQGLIHDDASFSDDAVLALATASSCVRAHSYEDEYLRFFTMFSEPNQWYLGTAGLGYGAMFLEWAIRDPGEPRVPYGSYGNGSGMRVPAIGWSNDSLVGVLNEARASALCTHNHPAGIKGAQAIAMAIWLARNAVSPEEIAHAVTAEFGYTFDFELEHLRRNYVFNATCSGSVPQAIWLALQGPDFETVMRNCLYIGGDTDTIACMAGSIAEPLYGIPPSILERCYQIIERDGPFLLDTFERFAGRYLPHYCNENGELLRITARPQEYRRLTLPNWVRKLWPKTSPQKDASGSRP